MSNVQSWVSAELAKLNKSNQTQSKSPTVGTRPVREVPAQKKPTVQIEEPCLNFSLLPWERAVHYTDNLLDSREPFFGVVHEEDEAAEQGTPRVYFSERCQPQRREQHMDLTTL